jgi:hypothetical protein
MDYEKHDQNQYGFTRKNIRNVSSKTKTDTNLPSGKLGESAANLTAS